MLFFSSQQAVGGGKVALLFLTRGGLHHERSWKLWLRSAAGILPFSVVDRDGGGVCGLDDAQIAGARDACSLERVDPDDAIAHQHLFSVYVHLSGDVDGTFANSIFFSFFSIPIQYMCSLKLSIFLTFFFIKHTHADAALGSLWRPHLVEHRVPTEWGTHSLVEATRSLLWEAFKDPSNQRFVLISEADVPIWDPLTFYSELMGDPRSRVDAWWHPNMDVGRWSWRMALSGARIRRSDWRKSAQWFSLLRSHVEVALRDEVVFTAFEEHCRSAFDGDYGKWRECFSDEHYLPTLLHKKGLQEETVPSPLGITVADWSEGNPHPHEYIADEVTSDTFTTRLRNNSDCPSVGWQHLAVQEGARKNFISIENVLGAQRNALCSASAASSGDSSGTNGIAGPSLPSGCSLLARKFPLASVDAVFSLFSDCSSGLMLVGDTECRLYSHSGAAADVVDILGGSSGSGRPRKVHTKTQTREGVVEEEVLH